MKKIILSLIALLTLISLCSCALKSGTTIKFTKLPETVYEAKNYTDEEIEALKENIVVEVSTLPSAINLNSDVLAVSGFDKLTLSNPGNYTLVVIFGSTNISFNYTVVEKIAPTPVGKAAELQPALEKGGIIELTSDITIDTRALLTESVTIYGNGYTITCKEGQDGRVFHAVGQQNKSYVFYDLNIQLVAVKPYTRGINIYDCKDVNLTVDNCEIRNVTYGINASDPSTNLNVVVKNESEIYAWAAINCAANNSNIMVVDSLLQGELVPGVGKGSFGTITLYSCNSNVEVSNCRVYAIQSTVENSLQYHVDIHKFKDYTGLELIEPALNIVKFENCDFGSEIEIYNFDNNQVFVDGNLQ